MSIIPKIIATFGEFVIEFLFYIQNVIFNIDALKCRPYLIVRILIERVKIHSNRSRKYYRILWYNGQFVSQVMYADIVYVDAIDKNAAVSVV